MTKRIITLLTLGLALVATHLHAEEQVLFRAILDMGAVKSFSLSDPAGANSKWVKLGGYYAGWELAAYDTETKTLTLDKDGESIQVAIATASAPSGDEGPAIAEATEVFRLMQFGKLMRDTMEQQKQAMIDMQRQMMEQASGGEPVDPKLLEIQAMAFDEMNRLIDWEAFEGDMINVYAETFSKENLGAIADFYGTPAGQSMVEKTPEVQAKTMEIIMPRIMEIMPAIQEKSVTMMKAYYAEKEAAAAEAPADTPQE